MPNAQVHGGRADRHDQLRPHLRHHRHRPRLSVCSVRISFGGGTMQIVNETCRRPCAGWATRPSDRAIIWHFVPTGSVLGAPPCRPMTLCRFACSIGGQRHPLLQTSRCGALQPVLRRWTSPDHQLPRRDDVDGPETLPASRSVDTRVSGVRATARLQVRQPMSSNRSTANAPRRTRCPCATILEAGRRRSPVRERIPATSVAHLRVPLA